MTKPLKEILLEIARLPESDQRWVIRRLSKEQRVKLEQHKGSSLLQDAQRFRKLTVRPKIIPVTVTEPLPSYCPQLASKTPLYAAIVLDQRAYPWKTPFLQQFDQDGLILQSLDHQVTHLKPPTKQALFNEWEKSISFETYLEGDHG